MFFVCQVENNNPSLGPIRNGKRAVSVYDRDLGNRRTVITTAEEADEFIADRKEAMNDAAKKGFLGTALLTAAGAGAGAYIEQGRKVAEAKRLSSIGSSLKDVIGPLFKAGGDGIDLKSVARTSAIRGALLGGTIAGVLGLLIPCKKTESADAKITKEFIDNNG